MDTEKAERDPRQVAAELAVKIRFLREEMKDGRGVDGTELLKNVKELTDLYSVESTVSTINFLVFDFIEKPGIGIAGVPWQNCLRIVQVLNPNRAGDATDEASVSLLPDILKHGGNLDVEYSYVSAFENHRSEI